MPVRPKAYPASKNALTVDAKYWKAFKILSTPQHIGAVTSIQFSPVDHYDFAVSSSTRVRFCEPQTVLTRCRCV